MSLKDTAVIDLAVKVNGKEKLVKKGKDLPKDADENLIAALRKSGLVVTTEVAETRSPSDAGDKAPAGDTLPADRDARDAWEAYAPKVGVDPAEFAGKNKPELVEAVTKAHEAKAAVASDQS